MQIITLDDCDFPDLLTAFSSGQIVGKYSKNGKNQIVCATQKFMMVMCDSKPDKIAIKPVRNITEAESLAKRLLKREEERGNSIWVPS